MDSPNLDPNDSDSGESWIIIENDSNETKEASKVPEHAGESFASENSKDEESDGVSIVTDSEPELPSPCLIDWEHCPLQENCAKKLHSPKLIQYKHEPEGDELDYVSLWYKKKTYEHRRNHDLNFFLDCLLLFTIIITFCIALGHIWGSTTDCSSQDPKNVNNILSNLYKLQEENTYLKNKLKELTVIHNYQMTRQKQTLKQKKCNKLFEAPLSNNDSEKITKCVDDKFVNSEKLSNSPTNEVVKNDKAEEFPNETEYLTSIIENYVESPKDFEKVKSNKYLYDSKTINKKQYEAPLESFSDTDNLANMNNEKDALKTNKKQEEDYGYGLNLEYTNANRDSTKYKEDNRHQNDDFTNHQKQQNIKIKENKTEKFKEKKVSREEIQDKFTNKQEFTKYKKDRLHKNKNRFKTKDIVDGKEVDTDKKNMDKKEDTEKNIIKIKNKDLNNVKKFKGGKQKEIYSSEEDVKKDDRNVSQKQKPKLKRNGKHQSKKSNKKRNKYEQWEMKGGLLRDYDDISLESSEDKAYLFNNPNLMKDNVYTHQSENYNSNDNKLDATSDNLDGGYIKDDSTNNKAGNEKDEISWLDKRARLRREARHKLEQESFGKNGVNAASWYFRRMHKREQSRGKDDNSTHRKLLKPSNYKFKH